MSDDDRELWESASQVEEKPEAAPEETPQEQPAVQRDEKGRFAAKVEDQQAGTVEQKPTPEAKPEQQQAQEHQGIPPWRLKEEADARRAAEERLAQRERELDALSRRMAEFERQNQPQQVPDMFEDPNGFIEHHNQRAIDPVKSEMAKLREFYSQRDAVRQHGAEKVQQAFQALDQAAKSGDPEAVAAVARVKQSMDPFGDIVAWHQKQTLFSEVGNDPAAYFERQLEQRMNDPAFQKTILERVRGQAQTRPPVTQLPPSLNKTPSAALADEDGEDTSEAGLLKTALRR